jgi:hypothetical protein
MQSDLTGPQMDADAVRAQTLFERLDSLGPRVRDQRLAVQQFMLSTKLRQKEQATGMLDDPHRVLRDFTSLLAGADSAGGIQGSATYGANWITVVLPLLGTRYLHDPKGTAAFVDSLVNATPRLGKLGPLMMGVASNLSNAFGSPVPPLQAQFWYHTQGDAVWPVPGHVSLLVLGGVTAKEAPMLRRLAKRYGPHGLRITVVEKTKGYWLKGGTETGPRTAAQEAAQDSAYYLGHLKLPVTLAITESSFARGSNGHVVQTSPVQYEHAWKGGRLVLVDATGHLLINLTVGEPFLNTYLDRVMGLASH